VRPGCTAAASTRRSPANGDSWLPACGPRWTSVAEDETTTDLGLVSLLELAPRDREVRTLLTDHLGSRPNAAHDLGALLLRRAQISAGGARS
jgi:hypothetical protein